jgi:hypothetical protein
MTFPVPWGRIVDLAHEVESERLAGREVPIEASLRLARAVLEFQEQLLAGLVKGRRGR